MDHPNDYHSRENNENEQQPLIEAVAQAALVSPGNIAAASIVLNLMMCAILTGLYGELRVQ